jgi:hypothetical protein
MSYRKNYLHQTNKQTHLINEGLKHIFTTQATKTKDKSSDWSGSTLEREALEQQAGHQGLICEQYNKQ